MANGDVLTGPAFPEEWYRGRSPLGFPVRLGLTGELRGTAQEGVAPTSGVVPPIPGGPGAGAAEAALPGPARQGGGAAPTGAGPSWLDVALRLGPRALDLLGAVAPSHARPADIESAWQAQRLGERMPWAQSLIAAGWTPQQIEAAQSVLGPMSAWEQQNLTPQDLQQIAGLMEGRVGDITIGMPPEIAGAFAEASTGGAETALREGMAAGGLSPQAAQTMGLPTGLATAPVSLMGGIVSSDPVVRRTLAENYPSWMVMGGDIASSLAAPFTFGLSTFAPAVVAGLTRAFESIFGGAPSYGKKLERLGTDLETMLPLWATALPYARSEADLQLLADLYNPWATSARFDPSTGLYVGKKEAAEAAEQFNQLWNQAVQQVRQTWDQPWQGPSMRDAIRQWIIQQVAERGGLPGWGLEQRRVGHILRSIGMDWSDPELVAAQQAFVDRWAAQQAAEAAAEQQRQLERTAAEAGMTLPEYLAEQERVRQLVESGGIVPWSDIPTP